MEDIIIGFENIYDIDKMTYSLISNHMNLYEIDLDSNTVTLHTKHLYNIPNLCYELDRDGYKVIYAAVQKDGYSIPLIEAFNDKEALENEVIYENNEFDLENFYVNQLEGAVCVITKNKTICANAVINHYSALKAIYNFLYNDLDQIQDYYSFSDDSCWQEEAVSYGNIVIQLCSDASSSVWLSENLNDYQVKELESFFGAIETIRKKHNIPIEIETLKPSEFMEEKTNMSKLG